MVCFLLERRKMEKLKEVETARALMTEAVSWSVMKWLREKKRVRKAADQANAVLDQLSQTIRTMACRTKNCVRGARVAECAWLNKARDRE
jgi:hypothetical protein